VVAAIAIAVGLGCGLVNGLLVTAGRVPAIIATLGTLYVFRGLVHQVSGGSQVLAFELPNSFKTFALREVLGVPALAVIAIVVAVLGAIVLRWTHWGRDFYAIGSNPDAARLSGIPVGRRVLLAFAISGALAGLGGFMFAARFANVSAASGSGFEFDVISAVVIGGVNVFGGVGTVLGAVLGGLFIGVIENGFTLLRINEFWKTAFQGFAIVAAVTVDALVTQRLQEALRRRRRREARAADLEAAA
jgi:rhamnose transport system permease protein